MFILEQVTTAALVMMSGLYCVLAFKQKDESERNFWIIVAWLAALSALVIMK